MEIRKIAIVTNYNIQEKLGAAMQVAEKLENVASDIFIPANYRERVMRAHKHRPSLT